MTTTRQKTGHHFLPFNPKSDVYDCFKIELTPAMAQHILDYYNKDNRKISNSQVNKIFNSIENDNWLLDGQPMTFNTDGNLTEFQHRLKAIAKCSQDRTFTVIVVVGVQPECFSLTAQNKARQSIDEIQRKYNKATKDQVSVLGDILKRRKGSRLKIQNAIVNYENWFKNICNAIDVRGDYESVVTKFSLQRKTISAFIALCERHGYLEECKTFLELLDGELEDDADSPVSTLSYEFLTYWNHAAVDLSNEKRMDVLYSLLCISLDRINMRGDGMISLNVLPSDLEHENMEKQGVYRKFLA